MYLYRISKLCKDTRNIPVWVGSGQGREREVEREDFCMLLILELCEYITIKKGEEAWTNLKEFSKVGRNFF